MKLLKSICILGMPAAGKTSFGRMLATHLNLPWTDLDCDLELRTGLPIGKIWDLHGEALFRAWERFLLLEILSNGPKIVSLGGGTAACMDGMYLIREFSYSIWLHTDASLLEQRLGQINRPVFLKSANSVYDQLVRLQEMRNPYFKRADLTIEVSSNEPIDLNYVTNICLKQGILSE
ncbi:MAG: hypothetical protein IPM34_08300 [Saprospiraceae bacterium]|nr:hypothetical protein [Saprospiraceae bacterium]